MALDGATRRGGYPYRQTFGPASGARVITGVSRTRWRARTCDLVVALNEFAGDA